MNALDEKGIKRGRPSLRSPEVEIRLVDALSMGIPMTVVCREEGMPEPRTVRDWEKNDPDFAAVIARAREEGEDYLAWECKAIADDGTNDYMDKLNADGEKIGQTLNAEHIQRSKVRIETRLKLLAKFNPTRWGDKVTAEHVGADGGPVLFAKVVREIVDPAKEKT